MSGHIAGISLQDAGPNKVRERERERERERVYISYGYIARNSHVGHALFFPFELVISVVLKRASLSMEVTEPFLREQSPFLFLFHVVRVCMCMKDMAGVVALISSIY